MRTHDLPMFSLLLCSVLDRVESIGISGATAERDGGGGGGVVGVMIITRRGGGFATRLSLSLSPSTWSCCFAE